MAENNCALKLPKMLPDT